MWQCGNAGVCVCVHAHVHAPGLTLIPVKTLEQNLLVEGFTVVKDRSRERD